MFHQCFSAEAHFYRCISQTYLSLPVSLAVCLSPSLLLALSSRSLLGIRPQLQCCDGRWQLAQKGWHIIGKCAAPKMSFLIKRFWSVVNYRMLGKMRACGLKYKDMIWKDNKEIYWTLLSIVCALFHFILKSLKDTVYTQSAWYWVGGHVKQTTKGWKIDKNIIKYSSNIHINWVYLPT